MKIEVSAYVKSGKLFIRNKNQFDLDVSKLNDCELWLTLEKKKSNRSMEQNKYWWVCMTLLSNHFGYTKDEMHNICKFMFLKSQKVDETSGLVFEYLKSTTELTKSEFSEMVEQMIRWSAEHGVVIPEPNQQLTLT